MINSIYTMELECNTRLSTLFKKNAFKDLIPTLVQLGIEGSNPFQPLLLLTTDNLTLRFEVTGNVKRVFEKEVYHGKVGLEFHSPPHHVLIVTNDVGKLRDFLKVLYVLMDQIMMEKLEHIPLIRRLSKGTLKSRGSPTVADKEWIEKISTCRRTRPKITFNLEERISTYLKEIDLPNCELEKIPVELGESSIELINFTDNRITDENLTWLEELPIRKSLKSLNLAGNRIQVFPSVLTDFHSLCALDFRDNHIKTIPSSIDQLYTLKYLNMSGNDLLYLPVTIDSLKLREVDFTYNKLTSSERAPYRPQSRNISKNCLSLRDISLMSVTAAQRRNLTHKLCPRSLLEDLRQMSRCVCGRRTVRDQRSQFYEKLFRVKFALTSKIHPQSSHFSGGPVRGWKYSGRDIGHVFLESHFCATCEDEFILFNRENVYNCFKLQSCVSLR